MPRYILKGACADGPGIVAAVAESLASLSGNILDLEQHTAVEKGLFLLRAGFDRAQPLAEGQFQAAFGPVASRFGMRWELHEAGARPKVAVLVGRTGHCLYELLLKHDDGHLRCDFLGIYSNHPDQAGTAAHFGVPFTHIPAEDQASHEAALQKALEASGAEFLVLARYMRVLSPAFIARWRDRILNIHHGFLPAFQGARPYERAWEKGVKIIGATAHFATEELDQGPIVAQGVVEASDRMSVEELKELGKDVERQVLYRALRLCLEQRVFIEGGRTFILD